MRDLIRNLLVLFLIGVMIAIGLGTLVNTTPQSETVTMVQPIGTPETDLTYSQANLNNAQANKANAEGESVRMVAESEASGNYSMIVLNWVIVGIVLVAGIWITQNIK